MNLKNTVSDILCETMSGFCSSVLMNLGSIFGAEFAPGEGRVRFLKVNKWLILRDLQTCALMVPLSKYPDPLYCKL